MIDVTQITWPESPKWKMLPDLPDRKLKKLMHRWLNYRVKYCAAAFELGIYIGGYKNCPSKDDVQTMINHYWDEEVPEEDKGPPPFYDPLIVGGMTFYGMLGTNFTENFCPIDTPDDQLDWADHAHIAIVSQAVWTCLIVGCNTMYLELQRRTRRGRPKKGE